MDTESLKDWIWAFWSVLTRPTVATFQGLGEKAEGKFIQALVWIYLTAGISSFLNLPFYDNKIEWLYELLISIIFIPLWFLLFAFCFSVVSERVFSIDSKIYQEFIYTASVVFVLGNLIPKVLSYVPTIGDIFRTATSVYFLVLFLIAIHGLTGLSLLKSLSLTLLSVLVTLPGYICGSAFLFRLIVTVPQVR